jgi:integrase
MPPNQFQELLKVRVGAEISKCGRARRVPLWWDAGTLEGLRAWKTEREQHAAIGDDYLVHLPHATRRGAVSRHTLRRRFQQACRVSGLARLRTITIHHGRHTFISYALAGGRTLAEVRLAAGHSNFITTSVYLHVAVDDDEEVGSLFARRTHSGSPCLVY